MKHSTHALCLGAAIAVLAGAGGAAAQSNPQEEGAVEFTASPRSSGVSRHSGSVGPLRVYGGFRVGVAGNFVNTGDGPDFENDADPTVGLQVGVDYVLHPYFAIGGETRFNFVKADGAGDRDMLWDLVVKPRGRYEFSNIPLEIYGALPVGLSVANLDDDNYGGVEVSGKAGATLGLLAGATYFFNSNMGINGETGAMFHWIHAEIEGPFGTSGDAKSRLGQFSLFAVNFVYAF